MKSGKVVIQPVSHYADSALPDVVRSLLRIDPALEAWLQEADPERLVVVKPNWVQESHEYLPDVWEPVITHPVVLLAVVEGLAELMRGQGTLAVCDAPNTYADFEGITARLNFAAQFACLRERFPRLRLELIDLRREIWIRKEEVVVERRPNPPDPRGYVRLDLGKESLFHAHRGEGRFYGADYDTRVVNLHHQGDVHEYLLAGTPVQCDLFVNVPKLKTHKKTGITCCLKNLVGINGDKNWLPHHTEGTPVTGGDEYPDRTFASSVEGAIKRLGQRAMLALPGAGGWLYRKARRVGKSVLGDSETVVRNGNWHGNDTCCRMALDLNGALLYGNPDESWRQPVQARRYLAIVDGIVGGEGNGPLCPDAVQAGVLLAGTNPAVVDAVACRLMGYDPAQLPIVTQAFAPHRWPLAACRLENVEVVDNRIGATVKLTQVDAAVAGGFRPPFGWAGLKRCPSGAGT